MILCYDTSNQGASLLIADTHGKVLKSSAYDETQKFSLPDALIALWNDLGNDLGREVGREMGRKVDMSPTQTTRMVITLGPGSYTGIRAGLAVLEAYRLVLPNMQFFGISNLAMLAWQARCDYPDFARYGIIGETKRKDYFLQCYDRAGNALNQARCVSGDEIVAEANKTDNMLLYGTAVQRFVSNHAISCKAVQQSFTAEQLLAFHFANPDDGFNQRTPLYLKPPDVSLPKKIFG